MPDPIMSNLCYFFGGGRGGGGGDPIMRISLGGSRILSDDIQHYHNLVFYV